MFTSEPTQSAKYFSTHRMVKMRANPAKAARIAEGTLVSSAGFSCFLVALLSQHVKLLSFSFHLPHVPVRISVFIGRQCGKRMTSSLEVVKMLINK